MKNDVSEAGFRLTGKESAFLSGWHLRQSYIQSMRTIVRQTCKDIQLRKDLVQAS